MTEQEILEKVCDIIRDLGGLKDPNLAPEQKLSEVGLDSLSVVEVVMACEDEFGIEIDPDASPETVGDFVALVQQLLG